MGRGEFSDHLSVVGSGERRVPWPSVCCRQWGRGGFSDRLSVVGSGEESSLTDSLLSAEGEMRFLIVYLLSAVAEMRLSGHLCVVGSREGRVLRPPVCCWQWGRGGFFDRLSIVCSRGEEGSLTACLL